MKFFCWNIRGINGPAKKQATKDLIRKHQPKIGALIETRVRDESSATHIVHSIAPLWNFTHNYASASLGRIWVIWDPSVVVNVYCVSEQMITCGFYDPTVASYVTISFIYALHTSSERRVLWQEIVNLAAHPLVSPRPWILMGDFNQILTPQEHASPTSQFIPHVGMSDLQNCFLASGLFDLAAQGNFLTWTNCSRENPIARKLDRAVVNDSLLLSFPDSYACFEDPAPSDHAACIVHIPQPRLLRRRTNFKFLLHLSKHETFYRLVSESWNSEIREGSHMFKLSLKLKRLKTVLRQLNRQAFSRIQERTARALDDLKLAQRSLLMNPTLVASFEEARLRSEWTVLSNAEESFLKQKSRIRWLAEGDHNTKFFHRVVASRHSTNSIRFLVSDAGERVYNLLDMKRMAIEYYRAILGEVDNDLMCWPVEEIRGFFPEGCNQGLLDSLDVLPTVEEIRDTIFSLPKGKAPGPDGYSAEFFTLCWDTVGTEVTEAVQEFFISGKILKQWNATLISLIPKTKNASRLREYRPISCCNTLYKIISRLLVDRLKKILSVVICPNQTAFIPGRSIIENVLLATELVSGFDRKGPPRQAMFKVDLTKAFDMVDWKFVIRILQALNLPSRFIGWIRECLTTLSFSISFNGETVGFFRGKRGLRQGDPLSPYLFVLVMDVLARLLNRQVAQGLITLPPKCRRPLISNLMFADDILVFSDCSPLSLQGVVNTFDLFYHTSGLKMNKEKTNVFMDGNQEHASSHLASLLGVNLAKLPVRYLGLPLSGKRITDRDCAKLKESIRGKLFSWTSRFLSFAGRLQLLKSVIYSIINFWSSAFLLPRHCTKELESMCSAFLWTGAPTSAKGAKVSWRSICTPKSSGGLGLRNLSDWNSILSLKLIWLIFSRGGSLWVAWAQTHFLSVKPFWDLKPQSKGSWMWRKLLKLRDLARPFLRCRVGNGMSCSFWFDSWLPLGPLIGFLGDGGPRLLGIPRYAKVRDACDGAGWVISAARSSTVEALHRCLLFVELPIHSTIEDEFYWSSNPTTLRLVPFSTSRAWKLFYSPLCQVSWSNIVWFTHSIPKHAFVCWLAARNRLPTRDRISAWSPNSHLGCLLCDSADESMDHLFAKCDFTFQLWDKLLHNAPFSWGPPESFNDALQWAAKCSDHRVLSLILLLLLQATVYHTWRERNLRLHQQQSRPSSIVAKEILASTRGRLSSIRAEWRPAIAEDSLLTYWFRYFEVL